MCAVSGKHQQKLTNFANTIRFITNSFLIRTEQPVASENRLTGLVITRIIAFGQYLPQAWTRSLTIEAFVLKRSSRVIPIHTNSNFKDVNLKSFKLHRSTLEIFRETSDATWVLDTTLQITFMHSDISYQISWRTECTIAIMKEPKYHSGS